MDESSISIFISYSRANKEFVDRLEADLRARSFRTWVDRRNLEGGRNWLDELQKAIERVDVLLVVLSPAAITSKNVRTEYRHAQRENKVVIPLQYQKCPKVPMELNDIHWVDFQSTYEQGLKDLLIALSRIELPVVISSPSTSIEMTKDEETDLVTPQPSPPPPSPSLNALYKLGVAAKAESNLERTATLWQQVLDRDPKFGNTILRSQMKRLMEELHPIRVQRLRKRAEEAHYMGEWGQEIGAWKALLGLEAKDIQAKDRIPIAEHNQKYEWLYVGAQQFVKEKNFKAARMQLEMLWQDAPFYGDPARLAKYTKNRVPTSYEDEQAYHRKMAKKIALRRRFRLYASMFLLELVVGAAIGALLGWLIGGQHGMPFSLITGMEIMSAAGAIIVPLSVTVSITFKRKQKAPDVVDAYNIQRIPDVVDAYDIFFNTLYKLSEREMNEEKDRNI